MIPWLTGDTPFPPIGRALRSPDGLLAAGGDLCAPRLMEAYRHGIFPWFNPGEPILWWSPDPRMVLIPGEFKISRSFAKVLRNSAYEVRCDTAFEQVMRGCAAPRPSHKPVGQGGTWIHEDMIAAYCELHRTGHAHSVETWMGGNLVGGLYGVGIGRMFYGESMFSHAVNASKIALAHLSRQLERWQFGMIDCQMNTPHLASLGAREIPRREFVARLQELINCKPVACWQFDADLFT
ncbi:MAG: leucyl/phenylalanyl-tRNA--protein transferase [Gallionellales bacterium RIFCSPLOWO2_12_FULL_59_22]|nr:MAG: leucyl/phenylalanyl-tRNA--protein transferase [Gallionellales bacterium RIFCSPLOWO2_02_FULL_59_110]OGT11378.1 MAG: leucyl/phenylalanyl-tRNA--protein transferase [Gallionellales bacterium RIFCSPLOWO2_12_FULL_59_22]